MFDTLTPTDARGLIDPPVDLDARRRYVGLPTPAEPDAQPDHWQGGDGYTGPLPKAGTDGAESYTKRLERAYVVEDCLSDTVQRRRNGLVGRPPTLRFEPDRDDDGVRDAQREAEDADPDAGALGADPAEADPAEAAAEAVTAAMLSWEPSAAGPGRSALAAVKRWIDGMSVAGRAYLRVYVPAGRVQAATEAGSPEAALRHVFVEALDADAAAVHVSADMVPLGVVAYRDGDDRAAGRGTNGEADATTPVEVSYLTSTGDRPLTAIAVLDAAGERLPADATPAEVAANRALPEEQRLAETWTGDLGGRITVFEGRMRPLVDTGAVSNQRDLNTKRTMAAINGHKAGFPSLVFVGVQPPEDEGGNAVARKTGPGQTGFYQVAIGVDQNGLPSGTTSHSVTQLGPVDNASMRDDAAEAREAIYRGARQTHVLAALGAAVSGDALLQGRGEFVQDLIDGAETVNEAGRWLFETAWRLACALTGAESRASGVRAVFACHPSAGPLTTGERLAIIRQHEAGLVSAETAMGLLGVADIEAERGRINDEVRRKAEREAAQGLALFGLGDADADDTNTAGAA